VDPVAPVYPVAPVTGPMSIQALPEYDHKCCVSCATTASPKTGLGSTARKFPGNAVATCPTIRIPCPVAPVAPAPVLP
jgi:hypothetical protein